MSSIQLPVDFVGVDGCREGWIAVFQCDGALGYSIHETFADLMTVFATARGVAVDIPIGLPSSMCPARDCDKLARKLLGARSSSVFSPPSRIAAQQREVGIARQKNIAELGKSLSAQAFGIAKKIAEVDEWLGRHPGAWDAVVEIHPEICFWAFNAKSPMAFPKKTRNGREERLQLLSRWEPGAEALLTQVLSDHRRSSVQPDDVLDALVALVTISGPENMLRRLPGELQVDAVGISMQMVYREV